MAANEQQFLEKISAKLQAGQFSQAAKTARIAAKKFPRNPSFPSQAGLALAQAGNHREAAREFAQVLKLAPGHLESENNLLQALVLSDQTDRLDPLLDRWLAQRSDQSDLLYLQAMSLIRRGRNFAALKSLTLALSQEPSTMRLYNLRASVLVSLGRDGAALADYDAMALLAPQDPDPVIHAANALIRLGRLEEAGARLNALPQSQTHRQVRETLGVLYSMQGNSDEAAACYQQVLARDPHKGMPWFQLAKLGALQNNPELQTQLAKTESDLQNSPATRNSQDAALIGFARARLCKDTGDTTGEAGHLARANRIEAINRPYDARAARALYSSHIECTLPPATSAEEAEPAPIFILGLPRSGTSLLEQILTTAPGVAGCGELAAGEALSDTLLAGHGDLKTGDDAQHFYRLALPELPAGTRFFTDKLPGNYKHIGILQAAFPRARFLNLNRDPRDVALSMWRGFFSAQGLDFTFDQIAMAHEMNLYQTYMSHWRAQPGIELLDVDYTDLVSNSEAVTKQVATFCGLDWGPEMIRPERNTRSVRTASAQQVRAPIHRRSLDGWRQFETALALLIKGLDPTLWPEPDL